MTYNELRTLALQSSTKNDNLFRETSRVAKTGLESAILENKIDKELFLLREKMNKSDYGADDFVFFQESINRCLDSLDEFLNDTVAKVPIYRESKVNSFFKSVYLYISALWKKIKEHFFNFISKFRKSKPYKSGEKIKPDKETEVKVNAKVSDAVKEYVDEDISRAVRSAGDELTPEDIKEMLSSTSTITNKSGEITFAKNIYDKVYSADIDPDAKRLMLDELMKTYDLKKLSKMFIDHTKSSPLLKGALSKYVKVLKVAKNNDDLAACRAIYGNMMLELASSTLFSDVDGHDVNYFDVEIGRIAHVLNSTKHKSSYSLNTVLNIFYGDKSDEGNIVYDTLKAVDEIGRIVREGNKDYLKTIRFQLKYHDGLFKTLPDEDDEDKWYNLCTGIAEVDLNQWYGSQLGVLHGIDEGLSKYNKVIESSTTSIMASELEGNKKAWADVKAYMEWNDILKDMIGSEALKGITPSSTEKLDKSRVSSTDANFDLYNKAVTYSELLDIIQATDENMYNKVPKTLRSMIKESSNGGVDTGILDEAIKRATTLFQVRLADEESVSADIAKRVKQSITVRTAATKQFMQAVTNMMKVAEMRRIDFRNLMTSFLEVLVADLGIEQYGILTVIEYILADKYLLDTAINDIVGNDK